MRRPFRLQAPRSCAHALCAVPLPQEYAVRLPTKSKHDRRTGVTGYLVGARLKGVLGRSAKSNKHNIASVFSLGRQAQAQNAAAQAAGENRRSSKVVPTTAAKYRWMAAGRRSMEQAAEEDDDADAPIVRPEGGLAFKVRVSQVHRHPDSQSAHNAP